VITNALIIDWSGIYKTDIGVKDGLIVGIAPGFLTRKLFDCHPETDGV